MKKRGRPFLRAQRNRHLKKKEKKGGDGGNSTLIPAAVNNGEKKDKGSHTPHISKNRAKSKRRHEKCGGNFSKKRRE